MTSTIADMAAMFAATNLPVIETERTYTLVCNKNAKVGLLYTSDVITSNVTIFPYASGDIYSHSEIPDNTDQNYIRFLTGQQPETIGKFLTSNYELDFTTDTFLSAYKRWFLKDVIRDRNIKLTESDWTQISDNSLSDSIKEAWRVYRQTLRDLPSNTEDPDNPIWPIRPDEVVVIEEETSNTVVSPE